MKIERRAEDHHPGIHISIAGTLVSFVVHVQIDARSSDPEGTLTGVVDTPHGGLEVETHHEAKSGNALRPHNYQPPTPPYYGRISGGEMRD